MKGKSLYDIKQIADKKTISKGKVVEKNFDIDSVPIRRDLEINFSKTLLRQRPIGEPAKLKPLMHKKTDKEAEKLKFVPNLYSKLDLKALTIRWYKDIVKAIEAVVAAENKQPDPKKPWEKTTKPARTLSRSDLSKTRPIEERNKLLDDKTLCFNNKGFFGTPLPLIPDIRKSEVEEGKIGLLLDAFGVSKKFERVVTLSKGPNKRKNRYLVFQYKRLIKSIDGTLVKGTTELSSHVIWAHDFYRLSAPDSGVCAKDRHVLRKKSRIYWGIGNQLLRQSKAFRMALIKKTLGKVERWFHRDIDVEDLFFINKAYTEIANKFDPRVTVKRFWIAKETESGTKFRPLGISGYSWRIFTRGLNNLLETFISGSWPDNQHGYKSGRGVHTAWNQVLRTVLKAKNILEFDFTGFFNTVRIERVADTLHRLYLPKYMIAYMVNITSCDVDNISKRQSKMFRNKYLMDWMDAWERYEYIHKYRKGYRSTGLPQGFALSPLLSVITLTALDDLEAIGIKYVIYADDGLFYSEDDVDFLGEAQKVLDQYGVGAYFNLKKCNYVKKDGIWKSKLKLVGLVYDPESDMLSASTRNGATLNLKIGVIAAFTDQEEEHIKLSHHAKWAERDSDDWEISNEKLFEIYEKIYVMKEFKTEWKVDLYGKLTLQIVSIMQNRLKKYSWNSICGMEYQEGAFLNPHEQFVFPLVILKHIDKDSYYELLEKYEKVMGDKLPIDVLKGIMRCYWMWNDHGQKEYLQQFEARAQYYSNYDSKDIYNGKINWTEEYYDRTATDLVLNQLVWFKGVDEIPDSVKNVLKDNTMELGQWFELTANDRKDIQIPKIVAEYLGKHSGKIGYTEVNWRNLYMDPAFATFIARLFQNTFRSEVVKQDFRLKKDRSCVTLMDMIDRYIGRYKFNESQGGINIFNATSFCANLLVKLLESWQKYLPNKLQDPRELSYKLIAKRIVNRRSLVDLYGKDDQYGEPYPLTPYVLLSNERIKKSIQHLRKKYKKGVIHSFDIKTIARSMISVQEIYTTHHANPRSALIYPLKNVRWDTLSPKKLVRKPFVKKVSLLQTEESKHPLLQPTVYNESGPWVPVVNKTVGTKWMSLREHLKLKLNISK